MNFLAHIYLSKENTGLILGNFSQKNKNMKYKITPNFFSVIILLIIGTALFKQFDFQNLKVEKPALAIVYGLAIILSIGFMIKKK